jgi:hypothetical protein
VKAFHVCVLRRLPLCTSTRIQFSRGSYCEDYNRVTVRRKTWPGASGVDQRGPGPHQPSLECEVASCSCWPNPVSPTDGTKPALGSRTVMASANPHRSPKTFWSDHRGRISALAACTGMRRSEIPRLRWPDVDLANNRLLLPHTKDHFGIVLENCLRYFCR